MVTQLNQTKEITMEQLPSTEHYVLEVVADPEHDELKMYGIRNTVTDVVEYFDNLLPRAYQALLAHEEGYMDMLSKVSGQSSGEVVSFPVDDDDESPEKEIH